MKELTYKKEEQFLSKHACFSISTKGRANKEPPCPMRTDFQRDRDRIIHSKSFRRLKNKTQVFLSPEGDHYRTRLTHTLDVSQIARTISRSLMLNEDLTEAIALGHDLGHTPFGHAGERVLAKLATCGFEHNDQSLRVVEFLENDGNGLNLTWEVRDGIHNHRSHLHPSTLEGKVVRIADKIAYINHDIDDALRAGIMTFDDIPVKFTKILGSTSRERINTMIISLCRGSKAGDTVEMEEDIYSATMGLRDFLFKNLYVESAAKLEEQKAERMLSLLFKYYMENPQVMPDFYQDKILPADGTERAVCDYISSMSDRYAVHSFENIFIPSSWSLDR